jgi:hypothetical protein
MPSDTQLFLAISAIGFGIQQFLQIIMDPLISAAITVIKDRQPPRLPDNIKLLPGGISDVDAKKALLGLSSFILGWIIVSGAPALHVLTVLGLPGFGAWDLFVSALIISAGTEGANSVLKLVQYSKDAVKSRTLPSIAQNSPVPQQPAAPVDQTVPAAATHLQLPSGAFRDADAEVTPNVGDDEAAEEAEERVDTEANAGGGTHMKMLAEAATAGGWRTAQCLLKLRAQVNQMAPNRTTASDGTIGDAAHQSRSSDHNPWVRDGAVGVVTALDITHDPTHGCDAGRIAEALRTSHDSRIKYIIWNRQIASSAPKHGRPAWAWRPYSGENPHTHHVHVSVQPQKALYDSTEQWVL